MVGKSKTTPDIWKSGINQNHRLGGDLKDYPCDLQVMFDMSLSLNDWLYS